MSNSEIWLNFGDGEYRFALPLPQIAELQRKCDIGIGGLFARVTKGCFVSPLDNQVHIDAKLGEFYALDLIETVRHGLIGGGKGLVNGEELAVSPARANQLMETYVLDQPLKPTWELAVSILAACIVGYDPPKKDQPPSEGAEPMDGSTSAEQEPT